MIAFRYKRITNHAAKSVYHTITLKHTNFFPLQGFIARRIRPSHQLFKSQIFNVLTGIEFSIVTSLFPMESERHNRSCAFTNVLNPRKPNPSLTNFHRNPPFVSYLVTKIDFNISIHNFQVFYSVISIEKVSFPL